MRLEDSKTGPRTVWLGPEAARLVAALPRRDGAARVFPEDLNSALLYTFWVGVREEAGLPGLRIQNARHTYASQGLTNGVGLATVGKLLGHRRRATTAIYAHLDDVAVRDAAALPDEADNARQRDRSHEWEPPSAARGRADRTEPATGPEKPVRPDPLDWTEDTPGPARGGAPPRPRGFDGLVRI